MLADFDIISNDNLNRQYFLIIRLANLKVYALKENLLRVNPELKVNALDIRLCSNDIIEIFNDWDVIVEDFDLAKMKQMIIETVLTFMPEKYIVSGIGLAGWGENNAENYHRIRIVCGDGEIEISETCLHLHHVLVLLLICRQIRYLKSCWENALRDRSNN